MKANRRNVLGAAWVVAASMLPQPGIFAANLDQSDAELLRIGREFEDAWNVSEEAWQDYEAFDMEAEDTGACIRARTACTAAHERVAALVAQIEQLPAFTLPGLLVKRRALAWCVCDDSFSLADLDCAEPATTDMRLIVSMLRDMTVMTVKQPPV